MSALDMISMAMRNLWKRKLRTFLTVLGVIIGTASIVVMMSIGIGLNESFEEQLQQMGSLNVIDVRKPWDGGDSSIEGEAKLDNRTLEEIKKIEGVGAVTPVLEEYFKLISGRYVADFSVVGILPETMEAFDYKLESGRILEEGDDFEVVLSAYVATEFYNPKVSWQYRWNSDNLVEVDVENDKFMVTFDYMYGEDGYDKSIKPLTVDVVGTLSDEGQNSWQSVMPIEAVEKLIELQEDYNKEQGYSSGSKKTGAKEYESAKVMVTDIKDVKEVKEIITNMGFETFSLSDILESMQEQSKLIQMVLGAIGAISLFVAAIGITNTMVMSIYERTREIGVMKVIGATLPDIKRLFLVEAAFIGMLGGIVGVILSYAISMIINKVAGGFGGFSSISSIPLWLSGSSIVFAAFIGIVAGYLPAKKATALSALAAIKTE